MRAGAPERPDLSRQLLRFLDVELHRRQDGAAGSFECVAVLGVQQRDRSWPIAARERLKNSACHRSGLIEIAAHRDPEVTLARQGREL